MTDDLASLCFSEAGPQPPATVRCYNMRDFHNRGEISEIPIISLEFLAAGIFGEGRPAWPGSTTKWTGDSHRYGVYRSPAGSYKNGIVLLETHGGGMFGYAFDNAETADTWDGITAILRPEMIWNVCRQITKVYHAARELERAVVYRAFIEGRVKLRRRHGQVYVEASAQNLDGPELMMVSGRSQRAS
jgi:hypothetical protein